MDEPTGRARGGVARMRGTTAKERKALAKKAAAARWSGDIKEIICGSEDRPLRIGDTAIPAYVLEDETRVLSQRGVQTGIAMSTSGGVGGAHRLAQFIERLADKGVNCRDLAVRIRKPILFKPIQGGKPAYGYEATMLADICDAVLGARRIPGALLPQQMHIADQCEILVRGFARVGIIALVDEATGYQYQRKKRDLAEILEAFIAKELQPWVKTFPDEYYAQLFRLRGLEFPKDSVKRPQYFGTLTNDIVWKRLAPGVLTELKRVIPKTDTGHRKGKLSQGLTRNIGYPKLRELLGAVVAYMSVSSNYKDFIEKLDRFRPRFSDQYELPFDYQPEEDSGIGL
jgi:P63C domain